MTKQEKEMWEDESPVHVDWFDWVFDIIICILVGGIILFGSFIVTKAKAPGIPLPIAGANKALMQARAKAEADWALKEYERIRQEAEQAAYDAKLTEVFGYVPSEDEISLVKHVAMHEAGNTEPHEGIVALMTCYANRVARDDRFECTITEVGYHPGQMTCVTDGSIWRYTVNKRVEKAWEDLINGGYKRHPGIVFWTAGYYNPYCKPAYQIGRHCFGY